MNVKELKEIIRDLPDELKILRADNSGGFETVYEAKLEDVTDVFQPNKPTVKVLLIGG